MKFVIDIEDFYLDEDSNLQPALVKHITREVVATITKGIQDKVDKQITEQVTTVMNSRLTFVINEKISELIDAGTIVKNGKPVSLVDHIKEMFNNNHGWQSPQSKMEAIAKKFGEELKAQYNNIFATKIVLGLKEQGMLKDEVVQMLLEGKK